MVRRTTTTTPLERRTEMIMILAMDAEEWAISSRIALTLIRSL